MKQTHLISAKGIGVVGLLVLTILVAGAPNFVLAADFSPPSAPTSLTAGTSTPNQVDLAWSAASDPETGISEHVIYRSIEFFTNATKNTSATGINRIGNLLSYIDDDPISGEDYFYAVSAVNGEGLEGPISNLATATVSGKLVTHYEFENISNKCRVCHKLHNSPARAKLFRKMPEIEICFTCHDGTGSDYNIESQWADSAHATTESILYSEDTFIQCTKCHSPHG
ncbi:MAG TPA: hypothetical protein ENI11_00400, partial [Actinobacteria bacterium]|nr:hypothetical protein [Actinomycetota bacterium]